MQAPSGIFSTILVANRGEIALRIMRTAQRMGYRTVAVYSAADRDAPHRHGADMALCIGGALPAESYLNSNALIDAARRSGAQAIHPGYGFLAENADFAQACADAGLVWIGPPPQAMRDMGGKAGAKRLMQAAGVPCIPGYEGEDQGVQRMVREAARIGYPVMVKASAGGGGRGMRKVDSAADFEQALQAARSEALHAFGDGALILEKAVIEPRHIEIQVFADIHGNVVHMGERDCSVQRRHQKLIEESPSPAVDAALGARMGEVAVAATRAINYRGAGTLEFLLDSEGLFYFMEMNTRLQVEHAVTEAVLELDLVEWQLCVAAGEALPLRQPQLDARRAAGGHAIEVRLCAEDASRNFLPQSGTVLRWQAPSGVRTDHALANGVVVPPYYDSMLAKLVSHGSDRADALRRLGGALDQTVLLGLASNRAFLAQCVRHPAFVRGEATTGFVARHFNGMHAGAADGAAATPAAAPSAAPAVAALLLVRGRTSGRYPTELQGWASSQSSPTLCRLALDGEVHTITLQAQGGQHWQAGGLTLQLVSDVDGMLALVADGVPLQVQWAADADGEGGCHFLLAGREYAAQPWRPAAAGSQQGSDGRITAPMNGRIAALPLAVGAPVAEGQVVLVIEAMKMEHSITAPVAGVLQSVSVAVGEQASPGQLLLEILVDVSAKS